MAKFKCLGSIKAWAATTPYGVGVAVVGILTVTYGSLHVDKIESAFPFALPDPTLWHLEPSAVLFWLFASLWSVLILVREIAWNENVRIKNGANSAWDWFLHLPFAAVLLFICCVHLFWGCFPHMTTHWIIVAVDAYLFLLMLSASLNLTNPLPERWVALITIPALFLTLVVSFASLYINNGHVKRENPDTRVTESLKEPWDAAYFSMVTMTTLGYGDYTPQLPDARKIVLGELGSGVLLLLFVIPVLASRVAAFNESTGTKKTVTIRRLDDKSWEVLEEGRSPTSYPIGQCLKITFAVKGDIDNIESVP